MITDTSLDRLTAKALASQWTPERIAWTTEPVLPERLPASIYVDMVSQLYYAELAALEVLERLHRELPDARAFLATQIADEQRHAAVYRRYLERIGDLAPIDPGLAAIFEYSRGSQMPAFAQVVALNIVMEHEALAQQQKRIDTLPCPLFAEINRAIISDESRHAGFGVIYLTQALPQASEADRAAVTAWVKHMWTMWCDANEGRYATSGAEVLRLERTHLGERWALMARRLAKLGLATEQELS
jgi:hypothetical protein